MRAVALLWAVVAIGRRSKLQCIARRFPHARTMLHLGTDRLKPQSGIEIAHVWFGTDARDGELQLPRKQGGIGKKAYAFGASRCRAYEAISRRLATQQQREHERLAQSVPAKGHRHLELRDAMRYVDRDQRHRGRAQALQEIRIGQTLGRRQHDARVAAIDVGFRLRQFLGTERTVDLRGVDAELSQPVALGLSPAR